MDGIAGPHLNILAFDTSTERAIIALLAETGQLHVAATEADRRHGRDLIPQLKKVLDQAGLAVADLELLAVGVGPGSYTGLRVGLMAAKTLAYVSGASLIGLDSLEVIAQNAPLDAERVSVVADAQRGDVYSASFARGASGRGWVRTRATAIEPASEWVARLEQGEFLTGPGLGVAKIRGLVPEKVTIADDQWHVPTAARLAECAVAAWLSGRRDDLWTLEPLYLRRSAAEEQWDNRGAAEPGGSAPTSADQHPNELTIDASSPSSGTP